MVITYKPEVKWRLDVLSQVAQLLFPYTFVICANLKKNEGYKWGHLDCHVICLQFTNQIQSGNRICFTSFYSSINFKFWQISWHEKKIIKMVLYWLPRDLLTIYRLHTPNFVSQVLQLLLSWSFVWSVGMNKL